MRETIERLISILDDTVDFGHSTRGSTTTFAEYAARPHPGADEQTTIKPLFQRFAHEILGFSHRTLIPESTTDGRRPDFKPADLATHPFLFEIKGTDVDDLTRYFAQVRTYLDRDRRINHAILTNMIDVVVVDRTGLVPLRQFTFSFLDLWRAWKQDPDAAIATPAAAAFTTFYEAFQHRILGVDEKLHRLREMPSWDHDGPALEGQELAALEAILREAVEEIQQEVVARVREHLIEAIDSDPNHRRWPLIAHEIGDLNHRIDSKYRPPEKGSASGLRRMLGPGAPEREAIDKLYAHRVALFELTRFLLVRAWEDSNLIPQVYYDGGFRRTYDFYEPEFRDYPEGVIRSVLSHGHDAAKRKYRWLFTDDNNYTWYKPSRTVIIDTLYRLAQFDFSRISDDVLGHLYEEFLDEEDRRNKGQYYTPREVIRLILDRVGYAGEAIASAQDVNGKHQRVFKRLFDPATGSGGFLVAAAQRIRQLAEADPSARTRNEKLMAIRESLVGCEIDEFAGYLTEINLLLQLTPLLDSRPGSRTAEIPTLSCVTVDSLKTGMFCGAQELFKRDDDLDPKIRRVVESSTYDDAKRVVLARMMKEFGYDYAVANPPYVGEKGNRRLFERSRREMPYLEDWYQGKMDYLYWFIMLCIEKVRAGGRLGFITTSYWPTADGAAELRQRILKSCTVDEMITFPYGRLSLFDSAQGQDNLIFVLTRCADLNIRRKNRIRICRVLARKWSDVPLADPELERLEPPSSLAVYRSRRRWLVRHIATKLAELRRDREYKDEYIHIFLGAATQEELVSGPPETARVGKRLSQAQIRFNRQLYIPWNRGMMTASERAVIDRIRAAGATLGDVEGQRNGVALINQGVISRADRLTRRNIAALGAAAQHGHRLGEGIFILSREERDALRLTARERRLTMRIYKNSAIGRYCVDTYDQEEQYLIYTHDDTALNASDHPNLYRHLERFQALLEASRDQYREDYPWWRLHRPRDPDILRAEKIVVARRENRNTFGIATGQLFENSDITIITKKEEVPESLHYILALLNSAVLDFWMRWMGKVKREKREYMDEPLRPTPIRRISFAPAKYLVDYEGKRRSERWVHDRLSTLTQELSAHMAELAAFDDFYNRRLTRLYEREELPRLDVVRVASEHGLRQVPLRLHRELRIDSSKLADPHGWRLRSVEMAGTSVTLLGVKRQGRIFVECRSGMLATVLQSRLAAAHGESWDSIAEIMVPESSNALERRLSEIAVQVERVRDAIRVKQIEIDERALDLYGIEDPDERALVLRHGAAEATGWQMRGAVDSDASDDDEDED